MKIFNNFGLSHTVAKISIREFKREWSIHHEPHSEKLLDAFIEENQINYAIHNFKTFNTNAHTYEDHQRVFYSEINNSIIVTVQPYRKNPVLFDYGFIELGKDVSWHYPNEAYLYVLKINQSDAGMFFIPLVDVLRISRKPDVDILYLKKGLIIAQKGSIEKTDDGRYSFVYAKKRGNAL